MSNCPSCHCANVEILESLDVNKIVWLYHQMSINTVYLFKNIGEINYCVCKICKLRFFMPFIEGDNDFYSQLQKMDWYFLHENKTEYTFSRKFIKQSDKVLDVGSGRGVFATHINCAFYQGIDTSLKAIELAKKDDRNVINQTIEEHAVEFKNYYNTVVAFQVLEHISKVDSFIQCCLDVLVSGGYFIIAVPNNDSFLQYASNNALNIPPHHQLHWNEKSLIFLANKYKLEIVTIFKEPVTKIHKEWYLMTKIKKRILEILHVKLQIIDNSIQYKILNKILNKIFSINSKIISKINIENAAGHSIIIVLKKH